MDSDAHLFAVQKADRILGGRGGGGRGGADAGTIRPAGDDIGIEQVRGADGRMRAMVLNGGQDRPGGVWVSYYLKQKPAAGVTLTFLDNRGQVIRTYGGPDTAGRGARVPAEAGTNRFVWDMTYPPAREIPPEPFNNLEWARALTPVAPPGTYKVQLKIGDRVLEQPFEIARDPRVSASDADLRAQFEFMINIRDRVSEVTDTVNRIRKTLARIDDVQKQHAGDVEIKAAADKARQNLVAVEGTLTRMLGPNPMFVPPKTLNIRLAALTAVAQSSDDRPTKQAYDVFEELSGQVSSQLTKLKQVEAQLPSMFRQ